MYRSEKICVVMPTYNNGGTLHDVVERVLTHCNHVIVVNDGCTDNSSEILASFGNQITVVDYGKNRGKGYALKQGFQKPKNKASTTSSPSIATDNIFPKIFLCLSTPWNKILEL